MCADSACADVMVRVFVAATPAEWLPMRVLEFSIREASSLPVEVSAIYTFDRPIPQPQALENRPRTPFSFQRFLIPELCKFSGRAIYLDADMQVFQDIAGLWQQPFFDHDILTVQSAGDGRSSQFSVMLLNCERLKWNINDIVAELDSGKLDYASLMFEMQIARNNGRSIPQEWNSLEHFSPGKTALLHYTDMNTQPWISTGNHNGYLWVECLRRALNAGFITRSDILKEVDSGHVRPSLLYQIDSNINDCCGIPLYELWQDFSFNPPFQSLIASRGDRVYLFCVRLFRLAKFLRLVVSQIFLVRYKSLWFR